MRYCLFIFYLLINLSAFAQLCTGSLGEPVVNNSFGNKNTAAGPLRPGVTNLGYVATGCPIDGNYTITNGALGCFSSSWHDINRDHTGDEEGRFMLINATNAPSVFFVDTITGLCGNTSYEFGAWVANVLKPSSCNGNGTKPNLTFTIETLAGAILETYNTGNINEDAVLTFKQYGFLFKPDINTTTIVLRIANNAGTGCGNDLALDDITFRPCGPAMTASIDGVSGFTAAIRNPILTNIRSADTGKYIVQVSTLEGCTANDTITITAFNAINGSYTGNTVICLGDSTLLSAVGGNQFEWYNNTRAIIGSNSTYLAKPSDTTNYQLLLRDAMGCADSITIPLYVIKPPEVDAGPNRSIMQGNSAALLGSIIGQNSGFIWSPTNSMLQQTTLTPLVSPFNTTTYTLTAYGLNGCPLTMDTVQVRVFVSIAPPNSFSPNGDGIHDIWLVPGLETYPFSELSIFNRAGQIVFQAKPYTDGWDGKYKGKDVPNGVYYYIINRGNGEALLSGSIYLIK